MRAWISRWMAAGFRSRVGVGEDVLSSSVDGGVLAARRCGVVGWSYFLVTFAPLRTLEISFCCGPG